MKLVFYFEVPLLFHAFLAENEAPCSSSPCQNGGSCEEVAQTEQTVYRCLCTIGWDGVNCHVKVCEFCLRDYLQFFTDDVLNTNM